MCGWPTSRSVLEENAPSASYLNIPAIIGAAEITDAMGIHPGYGFLKMQILPSR